MKSSFFRANGLLADDTRQGASLEWSWDGNEELYGKSFFHGDSGSSSSEKRDEKSVIDETPEAEWLH